MGMIECKECSAEISNLAKACPQCGAPNAAEPKPVKRTGSFCKTLLIALIALMAIGILMSALSEKGGTGAGGAPAGAAQTSNIDPMTKRVSAAAAALPVLRRMLRSPKSFELVKVTSSEPGVACFEYRAQNGFGGINVEHASLANNVVLVEQSQDFVRVWKQHCAVPAADITRDVVAVQDLFPDR